MIITTDNPGYTENLFNIQNKWNPAQPSDFEGDLQILTERLFPDSDLCTITTAETSEWSHAFVDDYAPHSHFDLLIRLIREGCDFPGGLLLQAKSGLKFHGLRGRPWQTLEGNLHLTLLWTPRKSIQNFYTGFQILAAVSLIETIDLLQGFKHSAQIKWVNDIWIDGCKVAGFLVHTMSAGDKVSDVIIGIGLNVEKSPALPADDYVPGAACLADFASNKSVFKPCQVLSLLLRRLSANYKLLLSGQYGRLLEIYRKRSLIIGREVRVMTDSEGKKPEETVRGVVEKIGEFLELYIKGYSKPVTQGRLIIID
jgi:BirA family biotin operon repressor/biotin-[acetyl-CoA-carboxylase] ligase